MTMHSCVATNHTRPEITTRRAGHVHFRERKLPLLAAAPVRGWCAAGARPGGRARSVGRGDTEYMGIFLASLEPNSCPYS